MSNKAFLSLLFGELGVDDSFLMDLINSFTNDLHKWGKLEYQKYRTPRKFLTENP